ncbi:hypothetical protein ACFYXS_03920 [Streptomyces sp. NPDC002574]|uniref:hypothetical protein n=1 Tax=Streptomyces sp. NPDC002574 TaxID=3364652 RepID=UPI003676CCA2
MALIAVRPQRCSTVEGGLQETALDRTGTGPIPAAAGGDAGGIVPRPGVQHTTPVNV